MNKVIPSHKSVLLKQVLELAMPENGRFFVDATFGLGGHSKAILEHYKSIEKLIGIDRDAEILEFSCETVNDNRIIRYQANASELPEVLENLKIKGVDGILLDLGVSSYQLDNPQRGFSFSKPGPLDMRMNQDQELTAEELINSAERNDLAEIIRNYGEEKFSGRIADAIVRIRQTCRITNTDQLAKIVYDAMPAQNRQKSLIHPATRTFQAIRIAVNKELEELEIFLERVLACLNPGGHLSIISFHSLEDRIVKNFFQSMQKGCECPPKFPICTCGKKPQMEILTRKAVFAEEDEIRQNPRARSARLRCAKKLKAGGKGNETR